MNWNAFRFQQDPVPESLQCRIAESNGRIAQTIAVLAQLHRRYPEHCADGNLIGDKGADGSVIGDIWDNILGHGEEDGVMACSFTALDKVRVEAALLFFGYDMTGEHSPWEVGLGFTVNRTKGDFRGKDAALALEEQERFVPAGIAVDHNDALACGEELLLDSEEAGVANRSAWSHRMQKSLALAHLQPDAARPSTQLEVVGGDRSTTAEVKTIPFFDPGKPRTHG